ncbi:NifU family protein [Dactylosporangium sp. NPDC051485]|uniref:NifU family protein n=1 Tax=Dactylosporangium sp. NPDC051485 TaxID=3154846 RepID=UPI0034264F72
MVPMHPQACPGDPDRLRWIIPAGTLSVTGALAAVPAPLAVLLADGTLAEVVAEPAAVVTRLGRGRSWSAEGPRVRTALHGALDEPTGWIAAHGPQGQGPGPDALLYAMAQQLLDGAAGQFARSHGGAIELLHVRDGVVTVRLGGACHGCLGAGRTLHQRLELQLRRRCPGVRAVVADNGRHHTGPGSLGA